MKTLDLCLPSDAREYIALWVEDFEFKTGRTATQVTLSGGRMVLLNKMSDADAVLIAQDLSEITQVAEDSGTAPSLGRLH